MTRRQSDYAPPPGKPQAHLLFPANCACSALGVVRDYCRAGLLGVPGPDGMEYARLACDLDVAKLIDQDVPDRVLAKHRRKSWSAYKQGRVCARCPSPIVDHSRTGLCGVCYRAGRYVRGSGRP